MRRLQQRGVVMQLGGPQMGSGGRAVRSAVSAVHAGGGGALVVGGCAGPLVVRHLLFGGDELLDALDRAVDVHLSSVSASGRERHHACRRGARVA